MSSRANSPVLRLPVKSCRCSSDDAAGRTENSCGMPAQLMLDFTTGTFATKPKDAFEGY